MLPHFAGTVELASHGLFPSIPDSFESRSVCHPSTPVCHWLYTKYMPKPDTRLVWSSTNGDLRKQESKHISPQVSLPPRQQTVYLHHESKGRAGKGVTLLKGLALNAVDLAALAKTIKQACGSGGTIRDGVIEIQGEQREKIAALLRDLGYKVKIAGG